MKSRTSATSSGVDRSARHDLSPHRLYPGGGLATQELGDVFVGDENRVTAKDQHSGNANSGDVFPQRGKLDTLLSGLFSVSASDKIVSPRPSADGKRGGMLRTPRRTADRSRFGLVTDAAVTPYLQTCRSINKATVSQVCAFCPPP
jgi:hypothetical protein